MVTFRSVPKIGSERICIAISKKASWSSIAKLAQLPAMRLTVFIPFIGIYLLFSQQTEPIFSFSHYFIDQIKISPEENFSNWSLYFTYFGLCLLGLASLGFALLCPSEIAANPDRNAFSFVENSSNGPVNSKTNFRFILNSYTRNTYLLREFENPEYPYSIRTAVTELVGEMLSDSEFAGPRDIPGVESNGAGYEDLNDLIVMISEDYKAAWIYTKPFYLLAPKYSVDISFLKFDTLNLNSHPKRIFILTMFAAGLFLLSVPTARVFSLLAYSLFFGEP
ncbi:hypothetical protein [Psychromarinibacter sp. S121]|uniref:hypothetical protein n=1 Tax=Psychromarinibacter sp. S121 TaxID=3415127 RepID=UPI003C79BBED